MIPRSGILDVSRETLERLEALEALLKKWNPAINMVSRATLEHAWDRHILDSAQIYRLGCHTGRWVDLGSGGGFPGLVVACLAADQRDPIEVILVESDKRKATFLQMASAQLSLHTTILPQRIEQIPNLEASTLSARALAALPVLLTYAKRHLGPTGLCLFPKGSTWQLEVEQARRDWNFDLETHRSMTDNQSVILVVKAISHV